MGIIAGNATKTNKVGFIGAIKEESIERFSIRIYGWTKGFK